jgi:hypothetical protein
MMLHHFSGREPDEPTDAYEHEPDGWQLCQAPQATGPRTPQPSSPTKPVTPNAQKDHES